MAELIKKSRELSNLPPIDNKILAKNAMTWAESLFLVVPEQDLKESFNEAFKLHDSSYPISAFEINAGYNALKALRSKQAEIERQRELTQVTTEMNSPHWEPCKLCFDCGFRQETRLFDGIPVHGVIRCYSCKYWVRRAKQFAN